MTDFHSVNETQRQLGALCGSGKLGSGLEALMISAHHHITRIAELKNMLEDVVNELDLSDGALEKHGPMGTPPAELVKLVLAEKDLQIAALKSGLIDIQQENDDG